MGEEVVKRVFTEKALPDDVLIEILLRLPVRSLLSFRSVSKHWFSLIQSPNFINLLNNRPFDTRFNHNPMLVLQTVDSKAVITLLSDDETLPYKDDLSLDILFGNVSKTGSLRLHGPCNGVFCLTDTFEIAVFNPTTKRCRKVPCSPFPQNSSSSSIFDFMGFGFDHVSNDYKVVRFNGYRELTVIIFSLSTNRWRKVKNVVPNCKMSGLRHNLFVNGAFHWLQVCDGDDSILVFDLNNESFKQFDLPNVIEESYFPLNLSILNESLAMVAHKKYNNHVDLEAFDIWVMMEYGVDKSWKNLFSISSALEIDRTLSFGKDGEIFLMNGDRQLVSFNLNTRVIKEFQIQKPKYAFRYTESLVSLKKC